MVDFDNIYKAFANVILNNVNGEELTGSDMDFPGVEYGVRGVEFVTAAVASSKNGSVWTEV